MHEMSIATSLMDCLLEIIRQRRLRRVLELEVRCGLAQQVAPEALQMAFQAVSAGTPAAGARLRIVEEQLLARCRSCDERFAAAIDDYRCPRCGLADAELLSGGDIVLQSVLGEVEGPPDAGEVCPGHDERLQTK